MSRKRVSSPGPVGWKCNQGTLPSVRRISVVRGRGRTGWGRKDVLDRTRGITVGKSQVWGISGRSSGDSRFPESEGGSEPSTQTLPITHPYDLPIPSPQGPDPEPDDGDV